VEGDRRGALENSRRRRWVSKNATFPAVSPRTPGRDRRITVGSCWRGNWGAAFRTLRRVRRRGRATFRSIVFLVQAEKQKRNSESIAVEDSLAKSKEIFERKILAKKSPD